MCALALEEIANAKEVAIGLLLCTQTAVSMISLRSKDISTIQTTTDILFNNIQKFTTSTPVPQQHSNSDRPGPKITQVLPGAGIRKRTGDTAISLSQEILWAARFGYCVRGRLATCHRTEAVSQARSRSHPLPKKDRS